MDFFIPRVHPTCAEEIRHLYRWCLSHGEIDVAAEDSLGIVPSDLRATVGFRLDPKLHRRQEFRSLQGQWGWLGVRHLRVAGPSVRSYLLCASFTESGNWVEFGVLENLFDFVDSVKPLDGVPDYVAERMDVEFERHRQISLAHWRELRNSDLRARSEELDRMCADKITALEERLVEIKQTLRQFRRRRSNVRVGGRHGGNIAQRAPDIDEQIWNLKDERNRVRQAILNTEVREAELRRQLLEEFAIKEELSTETLFTIEWYVKRAAGTTQ